MSVARLRTLEVRDFRNLAHIQLVMPSDGLVVVGDNGQGKTNLLEAIAYLHLLRSPRGARDIDVVRFGADGFSVCGTASLEPNPSFANGDEQGTDLGQGTDRQVMIGFARAARRKRVTIDGARPDRLSDALGAVPSVTFSPADIELVRGGPSGRRRYLDVVLATTSRRYLAALQRYRSALGQRNAALREAQRGGRTPASDAAVGAWEPFLAESGATLWDERARWAEAWRLELGRVCAAIGEQEAVEMRYAAHHPGGTAWTDAPPPAALQAALAHALEAARPGDIRRGMTRSGPHRDDLVLTLGGRDLRVYGSAGQQRTTAIGLRILEAATLRGRADTAPLLLFDDPFAELDERRSLAILDVLAGAGIGTPWPGGSATGQVVLAVPRAADIPRDLTRLDRARILAGALTGAAA